LVLVDLETSGGVMGHAYLFTYTPLALKPVADLVAGLEALAKGHPLAPSALFDMLNARLRLLGTEGLLGMAIAGLDMAAWDALAKVAGLPLAALLGGTVAPVPCYLSLRAMETTVLIAEARAAVAAGHKGVKIRLGAGDAAEDERVVRALRDALGPDVKLMADYNQALSRVEAEARLTRLDPLGLTWIEEPLAMHDLEGQAALAARIATPIQAGENWCGPEDAARSIAAGATDLVMPDAMKIGGVTGWTRAAALARAAGLPVSSHLFPEISAHLLAATPGAHLLEMLDLAGPVLTAPAEAANGAVTPSPAPGTGVAWNEAAVARYRVG
jgi:mandelate racemase